MGDMLGMFEAALGAYILYCAITGKGQLYKNDKIKKGMEKQYFKSMRNISWALGPAMLITGVVDMSNADRQNPVLNIAFGVLMGLTFILIAVMFVMSYRMTDRTKVAQAKQKGEQPLSRAAFEFDEDDK